VTARFCYRVRVAVRYLPGRRFMTWAPIITANSPAEARERAAALYGGWTEQPWECKVRTSGGREREHGPGLPPRAEIVILDVELRHAAAIHNVWPLEETP
jgi:hypothetical protein